MSRSRLVLVVAWGLLAAGSLVHFVQTADDDPVSTAAAPAALADRGGAGQGPIPAPLDPETGATSGTDSGSDSDPDPGSNSGTDADANATSATADQGVTDGDDPAEDAARQRATIPGGQQPPVPERFDAPETWPTVVRPAIVATVIGDGVAALAEPGSGPETHWFANPTQFGGQRTFLVVDATSSDDHVKVSLPAMPNGQEGWLPRSAVELSTVSHRAEVDLSDTTVTVWDGDEVIVTTKAVIGRRSAPTPLGRFYVRDLIAQPTPDGDYGPWILALSGFSEVLETFDGGLPALALHGTDEPVEIGNALSSGCVRVPNDVITTLAETVPLGTPVDVVA